MLEKIKSNKKIIVILLIVIVVLGFGSYMYREKSAEREAASQLTLKGNVDLREVSLAFRNSDRISEMYVEEGDQVTKGQVLARLETEDLMHQIAVTKANIGAQEAQVDKLHHGTRAEDLAQARAKVDAAEAERDFLAASPGNRTGDFLQDLFLMALCFHGRTFKIIELRTERQEHIGIYVR